MLLGWTNCNAWTARTASVYTSAPFLAKAAEYAHFMTTLASSGLVGGRDVTLSNMWNIFDFMNVQGVRISQMALGCCELTLAARFTTPPTPHS